MTTKLSCCRSREVQINSCKNVNLKIIISEKNQGSYFVGSTHFTGIFQFIFTYPQNPKNKSSTILGPTVGSLVPYKCDKIWVFRKIIGLEPALLKDEKMYWPLEN